MCFPYKMEGQNVGSEVVLVEEGEEQIEKVMSAKWGESTTYGYVKALGRFFAWLTENPRFSGVLSIDLEDGAQERLNENFSFSILHLFATSMKVKGGQAMSYSALNQYSSAVKWHLRTVAKLKLSDEELSLHSQFLSGWKKKCAKEKQNGTRSLEEGKSAMPFPIYIELARYWWRTGNSFALTYHLLTWNLGCRTNNTEKIRMSHLLWLGDSLQINFGVSKSNQDGEKKESRLIFANPLCPEICPVLGLGWYLASLSTPLTTEDKLFIGGSQSIRFLKNLKVALESPELREVLTFHGTNPDDFGAHSLRKGAATFLCNGSTVSPSYSSICIRMGWSQGVQERYLKYQFAADAYCGRILCGLPQNQVEFGLLPPHTASPLDFSVTRLAFPTEDIETLEPIRQFCLSSLLFHSKFVAKAAPATSAIHQSYIFRNCLALVPSVICGLTSPVLTANGLPPHVLTWIHHQKMESMIQKLPDQVMSQMDEKLRSILHEEGVAAGNVTPEMMRGFMRELLTTDRQNRQVQETLEVAPDPSCFPVHLWSDGRFHRLPESFILPNVSVLFCWLLWWEGNREEKIPPLHLLEFIDVPPSQRKKFSDITCLMRYLVKWCENEKQLSIPEIKKMMPEDRIPLCLEAFKALPQKKKKNIVRSAEWMVSTALREVREAEKETREIEEEREEKRKKRRETNRKR